MARLQIECPKAILESDNDSKSASGSSKPLDDTSRLVGLVLEGLDRSLAKVKCY
jgi:hypothetical protein